MKFRPPFFAFLVLLLSGFLDRELHAQTTTSGALAGVISDQTSAVIPNANVELMDNSKGSTQFAKTDQEGVYRFSFLAPGSYTLIVSAVAFQEAKRSVNVTLGPPVSVNLSLAIAKASSEVAVTSEAPLVQAENGDAAATVNQKQISELPNPGNDLTYIVQTTPGVVMNTDQGGGNFSILGMPSVSYLFTIDGADNPATGALGLLLGQNQVQETTVLSTGYSGQFGGAAGANINYITKSGTNEFHGNAQYYWNGSVFNANDWFNNAFHIPRPFDIANQWAGSIGGPLKKSKLFFFFDSEGLRVTVPSFLTAQVPSTEFQAAILANIDSRFGATSASDAFYRKMFKLYNGAPGIAVALPGSVVPGDPGCGDFQGLGPGVPCMLHFTTSRSRPSQDALNSGRVDWNVGVKDRAFLKLQNDSGYSAVYTDPITSVFDNDLHQHWWQTQFIETHAFGPSAALQSLLTAAYIDDVFGPADVRKSLQAFPTYLFFNTEEQLYPLGNGSSFRGYETQYQISEDFVKAWGNHNFGLGGNFERFYSTVVASTASGPAIGIGVLSVQTLDALYQGGVDPASPEVDFTQLSQSFPPNSSQRVASYHFGIYGQDEWRVRPNLSLTLALRMEHQSNPTCQNRCYARLTGPFKGIIHDPGQPYNEAILVNQKQAFMARDNILWSPRFSFAWQPFGLSRNIVLRGGVGIFYDPGPDGIGSSLSSNPPLVNSFTVSGNNMAPGETNSLFADAGASNAAFVDAFSSGSTLAEIKATLPNFFPPAVAALERRTHSPQYQRWSLQLQRAFGASSSLSVGYFGHHGIHELVQNPSANAWGFGSLPPGRCPDPIPDCAPDPRFSAVTEFDTNAISTYNGMVISFQHRLRRWSQGIFQANYTYGHALDEVSNGGIFTFANSNRTPFSVSPQDPNHLRDSYGPADYDVRHSFNANYVWELPVKAVLRGHGPDRLVSGWQVSGTIFARTGLPYTALDFLGLGNLQAKNYFGLLYAVPVRPLHSMPACGKGAAVPLAPRPCLPPQDIIQPDGTTALNPNALFLQAGCETGFNSGNLPAPTGPCDGPVVFFAQGRNRFRGPGYFNTDFTIMKHTKIPRWEKANLGIGFQFFNLFNHPNFGFPGTGLVQGLGLISNLEQPPTSILGTGNGGFGADVAPRMIQLKAQLLF
jgi:Carboxypeptidase regulatory-like domain